MNERIGEFYIYIPSGLVGELDNNLDSAIILCQLNLYAAVFKTKYNQDEFYIPSTGPNPSLEAWIGKRSKATFWTLINKLVEKKLIERVTCRTGFGARNRYKILNHDLNRALQSWLIDTQIQIGEETLILKSALSDELG